MTNNLGYFNLKLPTGLQLLKVSSLGYEEDTISLILRKDTVIHFYLQTKSLPEVTITEQAPIKIEGGNIRFTPEALKNNIFILGEQDVLKYLQLYSGVSPGVDGSNQYGVRGGGVDQNMLLVDGSILYNTSHLFGLISSLDPNSIKSATFYKGSYPADLGGRLSSILEVSLKEGNRYKRNHKVSLGLITASAFTEGPIKKGVSSYMFSFRTAFPGLFTQGSKSAFNSNKKDGYLSFFMHDFNVKLNTDLGTKNTLFFSAYSGNDLWSNGFREPPIITRWNLNWGNQMASVKLQSVLSKSTHLITQLNINRFYYSSKISSNTIDAPSASSFTNQSNISDYKIKSILETNLNSFLTINTGAEYTRSLIRPQVNFILSDNIIKEPTKDEANHANQLAAFFAGKILIRPLGVWTLGIRMNVHEVQNKRSPYVQYEPRIKWDFKVTKKVNVFASYMRVHQYLHLISNPTGGYVTDVWVPVTNTLHPQSMDEYAIGTEINSEKKIKNINLQLFYRNYDKQASLRSDLNLIKDDILSWEDLLVLNGKGKSFGMESSIQFNIGTLNIISSYTYSKSQRKFTEINKGGWYDHDLDRRHILNSNFTYRMNKKFVVNSNFVFNTGQPLTIPKQAIFGLDPNKPELNYVYTERNNARSAKYIRLDLGIRKEITTSKNNSKEWTLGIYNVLLQKNVFVVDYTNRYRFDDVITRKNPYFLNEKKVRSYLLFIPGLSFAYAW